MANNISDEEPVIDAAKIAAKVTGTITAIGGLASLYGYGTETDYSAFAAASGTLVMAGGALVGTILPIINAFKARSKVTPLANPKSDAGIPLVEAPPLR